jgi:protein-S-isoprenylcysteine O-methyltransferase Ste14
MRPLPFSAGPMFAAIFWIAFALWTVPEAIAGRSKRSTDSAKPVDRGSLKLIAALWLIGIGLNFYLSLSLPQATITWHRVPLFVCGISLILAGVWLRWYSVAVLGKYFTFDVAIQNGQTVVEAGPYRYVRHPSYSGALLSLFGFGLSLGNWAGLAASFSCLGLAYAYRIPVEEAALTSGLGEPYRQYRKRTRYLVPFVF